MKCRKCSREIEDNSIFCNWCGTKQQIEQAAKHRGNGQGTAIKRGSTWTAIWTVETYLSSDGKIHQKRATKGGFSSKRDALAYAAKPPQEEKKAPTLRNYWDGWSTSELLKLGKSKQCAYNIAWKRLEPLAGKRMDELTINHLQLCVDEKTETYYPAKDMKTVLSHLYKRAVAEGSARTNLADFLTLPPLDEKEIMPFNELELHKLWDAYGKGDRFIGYMLLMIYSGMMPGELFNFKSNMVNWETNEIIGCGLKTKKRKEVPIVFPDIIAPVLQDLIEHSNSRVDYVLCMNRDNFYDEYHAATARAGVRDLPPYSCRHTTATALALGNIAPSVIQEVMRHTKFATTQRYIHPTTDAAREAVNQIGKGKTN